MLSFRVAGFRGAPLPLRPGPWLVLPPWSVQGSAGVAAA
jgi:hypothetical protein